MTAFFTTIIRRYLWPEIDEHPPLAQMAVATSLLAATYSFPLAVLGLIWLALETKFSIVTDHWQLFLVLLGMTAITNVLVFFMAANIGNISGGASFSGSLSIIMIWTALLLLGPSGLWIAVIVVVGRRLQQYASRNFQNWREIPTRLQLLRLLAESLVEITVVNISAYYVYRTLGGEIPFGDFSLRPFGIALIAVLVRFLLAEALSIPYLFYVSRAIKALGAESSGDIWRFSLLAMLFSLPIQPFSILSAGIYSIGGWGPFLFFCAALVLTCALANLLGRAAERSRQRSQELAQLVQLSRAIIDSPPDSNNLAELLAVHVPSMFTLSGIVIRLFPDQNLLMFPENISLPASFWSWIRKQRETGYSALGQASPWQPDEKNRNSVLWSPILDNATNRIIGAVCILTPQTERDGVVDWLPALESLAGQISAYLHRTQTYQQALEHQKTIQELSLAGRIQSSFLPDSIPQVSGWQITASLTPARQTSGDFYDFISLPDQKLGILVADVADKGVGAALYMALSRTLIRTYALEYPDHPHEVLRAANERILQDTQSDLFVTVFYGVLDVGMGRFSYSNAGHNPGYLIYHRGDEQPTIRHLPRTGIPLGMFTDMKWREEIITIGDGAVLILYSDGLTEAHAPDSAMFGEDRLLNLVLENEQATANELQTRIISAVEAFMSTAPQFDDITLVTVKRAH